MDGKKMKGEEELGDCGCGSDGFDSEGKHECKDAIWELTAAAAKSRQLRPTLCDPIDGSPWGSPVPGILQARILERVAISFSMRTHYAMLC